MLLIAALVWLVNGLHARPDDRNYARNLVTASLPHTARVNIDESVVLWPTRTDIDVDGNGPISCTVPWVSNGLVFFRDLRIPPIVPMPRFTASHLCLSDSAFEFYFGKDMDPDTVRRQVRPMGIVRRDDIPSTRVGGSRARITPRSLEDEDPQPITNLAGLGFRLAPMNVDDGSDLEDGFEPEPQTLDPDIRLAKILRQFWIDLVVKSPNPRSAIEPSYLKLTREERLGADQDLFMRTDLPELFSCFYHRRAQKEDWKRAFDHLFPPKGHTLAGKNIQNYPSCRYYTEWKELVALQHNETVLAMRFELKKVFNKLKWIPEPSQDKIWTSKVPRSNRYRAFPAGLERAAPILLIKFNPEWGRAGEGWPLGELPFYLSQYRAQSSENRRSHP